MNKEESRWSVYFNFLSYNDSENEARKENEEEYSEGDYGKEFIYPELTHKLSEENGHVHKYILRNKNTVEYRYRHDTINGRVTNKHKYTRWF